MQSSSARRAAFGASLTNNSTTTTTTTTTTNLPPGLTQIQPSQITTTTSTPLPAPSTTSNSSNDKGKQRANDNNSNQRSRKPRSTQQQSIQTKSSILPNNNNNEIKVIVPIEDDDGSQCFICAEPVIYYALGECDHRTCHTCAIRLRALYKKNNCVFCKHECSRIVITSSPTLPFTSFPPAATPFTDTKLGISFESRAQMDESLSLLRFNCPLTPTCSIISLGWSDLKRHAHSEHSSSLCDLCCSFKKIFSHEHTLYTGRDLVKHKNEEHMMCDFCNIGFYDADSLYAHCRDRHEECFVCIKHGIRHQYHRNYDRLEAHYKSSHYLCPHPTCLEEKFVVFESEIDLQAHAVSKHGAALSGDQRARRDARRIETNFSHEYEETNGGSNRNGTRGGGGNSRGGRGGASSSRGQGERREANGSTGNSSSSTSSSASFITTGDGLSRNRVIPGLGARLPNQNTRGEGGNGRDAPPHSRSVTPAPSIAVENTSSDRDDTLEKHAALMQRVATIVSSDSKITSFKSAVRGFKGSESSAEDLVDTLWNIFDRQVDVAAGIISSVADLFEDVEKRANVLSAWQDLRAKQNQFPSLAPLGPALNGIPTTINSTSRALQSTNTRSHRDPVVWARVANAAGSVAPPRPLQPQQPPKEKFPALPAMVPGMKGFGRSNVGNTPWSAASTTAFNPISIGGSNSLGTSSITINRSNEFERIPIASPSLPFAKPTFITNEINNNNNKNKGGAGGGGGRGEFPSLPSSTLESDRRARVRAALSKPDPSIVDREEFGTGSFWGANSGNSTRSGSPEPSYSSSSRNSNNNGGGGDGSGQMQKKKKKEKILLFSNGDGRG